MNTKHKKTMTLNLALLSAGLAAGLLSAGCVPGAASARAQFKEEVHQTYRLAADGRLSLANVNGSIRLSVWDRPEVQLEAVKRASREQDLAGIKILVDSKPDSLTIRTKSPESWGWWGWRRRCSVDYTLTVPALVRLEDVSSVNGLIGIDGARGPLKASTVNGTLSAEGLAGNASLSSVNGVVHAGFVSLEKVKSISASTVNGACELNLPAGANADVSASTVNGRITGDVPVKKNWPVGCEVKARLGQGGTKVHLSTVNGGVRIHLVKPEAEKAP